MAHKARPNYMWCTGDISKKDSDRSKIEACANGNDK